MAKLRTHVTQNNKKKKMNCKICKNVTTSETELSYPTLYCPTNAHNFKKVELLKHFKIRKLLQHVSVYKETIIREPLPVLS